MGTRADICMEMRIAMLARVRLSDTHPNHGSARVANNMSMHMSKHTCVHLRAGVDMCLGLCLEMSFRHVQIAMTAV